MLSFIRLTAIGFLLCIGAGLGFAKDTEQERAEIQKMRSKTLAKLYRIHPAAKSNVQKSAGYAVFSNVGINLLVLSASGGHGVAHDNKTGQDTYMKMISGGVGIGLRSWRNGSVTGP